MVKTQEELNVLKEEVETVNEKLRELTPEELAQVSGGGPAVVEPHGIVSSGIVPVGAPVETLAIEELAVVADPRKR